MRFFSFSNTQILEKKEEKMEPIEFMVDAASEESNIGSAIDEMLTKKEETPETPKKEVVKNVMMTFPIPLKLVCSCGKMKKKPKKKIVKSKPQPVLTKRKIIRLE